MLPRLARSPVSAPTTVRLGVLPTLPPINGSRTTGSFRTAATIAAAPFASKNCLKLCFCSKSSIHTRNYHSAMDQVNPTSLNSFNANHASYDTYRPSYPEDAVRLCASLSSGHHNSLEVAAGTGKFTKQVLKYLPSSRYVATEPSTGMAKSFQKNLPDIKFVAAPSTDLPFENESFDVIYIAQAFHWFSTKESVQEFARVLRPGGHLVMLWNFEDLKKMPEWQRRTSEEVWKYDHDVPQYRHLQWDQVLKDSEQFKGYCERFFPYQINVGDSQHLWDYWKTRSYITALDESKQNEIRDKIFEYTKGIGELDAARGCHVVWLTKV